MPRALQLTGQATDLVFALTFDDDNSTLKEFVDADVNTSKTVEGGVTFGTTTYKGQTRGYFQTAADGDFGFEGIHWDAADAAQVDFAVSSGACIVILVAGSDAGANFKRFVTFGGTTSGMGVSDAGKPLIDLGGGGCEGASTVPTNGTTKYFMAGNWDGAFGSGTSEIFYALESASDVASENTESQGEFGSNGATLRDIGGADGNGNLPAKIIALYVFDSKRTLGQLQALFDDDIAELFGESEPGSIEDASARFSGGSTNGSPEASIGGAESSRSLVVGTGHAGVRNNLFDPITPAQATSGHTDYRCFYLKGDPDGDLATVTLWIHDNADESHTTFAIGLDSNGVGGTAVTPSNETTAPSGVTFSAPSSGSPLNIGNIPPNSSIAVWIRRTVTAGAAFTALDSLTLRAGDGTTTKDFSFQHCVQAAEARAWAAIGTNTMSSNDPCPGGGCGFSGSGGQAAVISKWGGGAFRQTATVNELTCWGGGHGDYGGNEVYGFQTGTKTWSARTSPSVASGGSEASGLYGDGLPRSTHTYSYLEYDPINDRMFSASIPAPYVGATVSSPRAVAFDYATNTWDTTLPTGGPANPQGGGVGGVNIGRTCYVTGRAQIWFEPASSRDNWALFDLATDTWGDYQGGNGTDSTTVLAVYDSRRHKVYGLGNQSSSQITIWDLHAGGNSSKQATTGTGASTITASQTLGACYDEILDRVIAWDGGQTLRVLDPSTFVWTTLTVSGATPTTPQALGTYGRFRYIKPCTQYPQGGYIVVNANNQSVYVFATESTGSVSAAAAGIGASTGQCVGALLRSAAAVGVGTGSSVAAGVLLAAGVAQACAAGTGASAGVFLTSGTAQGVALGTGALSAASIVGAIAQAVGMATSDVLASELLSALASACGVSVGAFSQLQGIIVSGAADGTAMAFGAGFAAEILAGSAESISASTAHLRESLLKDAAAHGISKSSALAIPAATLDGIAQALAVASGLFSQETISIVSGAAIGVGGSTGVSTAALLIGAPATADAAGIALALAAQLLKAQASGCAIGSGIPAAALVLGARAEAVAESIGVVLAQSGSEVLQAVRVIYVNRENRTIVVPRSRGKLN